MFSFYPYHKRASNYFQVFQGQARPIIDSKETIESVLLKCCNIDDGFIYFEVQGYVENTKLDVL